MKFDATDNQDSVLIIGYGNTLRADDGVGVIVAQLVEDQMQPSRVRVITAPQLGPEMADYMASVQRVVFIDACTNLPPGQVTFKQIQADDCTLGPLGHHLRPATLLAMTEALYGRSPEVRVMTVGAESLAYGEGLSATVNHAVERMTALLLSCIQQPEVAHA